MQLKIPMPCQRQSDSDARHTWSCVANRRPRPIRV